jgi:hypothetical protein
MYSGGVPADPDAATTTASNSFLSDSKPTARPSNPKPDHAGASSEGAPRHKTAYLAPSRPHKLAKALENWKGPSNRISRIYGDWLEDDE